MNYKSKAAITLLSLLTLTACGNDENKPNIDTGTDPDQDNSNLLVNGDFEAWSAELPTDWTTIDSGINITKESLIYKTGLRSAEVYVNTGDQGNTDFRQSVDVEAGKEYTFSTWIYHTEGYVKARLYVGGNYSNNYSANNLVNQWQEVTYTYTAKDNLSIEIGVRFYDQSGFDGSEVVYLDNFSFISDTVLPPVDPDPGPNPDPDPDPDPEPGPDPEIPENYNENAKNKPVSS